MEQKAVVVQDLVKEYPRVRAVDKVSFTVDKGEILWLLVPNGAGQDNDYSDSDHLINLTSGKATVFDVDVAGNGERVRNMCGYVPQDVSADGDLTAYENILIYAKLYSMPGKERKTRIQEALGLLRVQGESQ